MTPSTVPPEFSAVALRDRHTWHRATLQQWIDQRDRVLAKKADMDRARERMAEYWRANQVALSRLWQEETAAGRPANVQLTRRLKQRLGALRGPTHARRPRLQPPFTAWEWDFLQASRWVDDVLARVQSDPLDPVSLLAEWVQTIEGDFHVAETRAKDRVRRQRALREPGVIHTKGNCNPYYPAPIDVVGVYLAVLAILGHARRTEDRLAYVRGETRERTDSNPRARTRVAAPSSIRGFRDSLLRLGFTPLASQDEINAWRGWNKARSRGCATLAYEVVAMIFGVKPATVRRGTCPGVLTARYDHYNVPKRYRLYRPQDSQPRTTVLRPVGWYLNKPLEAVDLVSGHTYFV